MPTTLTGLLLLVILLLPGLTYVIIRERQGTERRLSPFRETGAVIFGSIVSELVVLTMFAIVRSRWPQATPDVGKLIREGSTYAKAHYAPLAVWALVLLLLASILAGLAASVPTLASRIQRPQWVAQRAARWGNRWNHPSTVSAWWRMFKEWHPDAEIYVVCTLNDGSLIEGSPISFSISADDSPDRDLILAEPRYRPPGATGNAQPYDAGAVCVSARNIVAMFVSHFPATGPAGMTADGQTASVAAPLPHPSAPAFQG
ncbi:DUF6338 family protein [Streptomyces wuyuanensis]|uniref:DUF6338 family protein n=1 Tax=Streptomyces wuyuanensis TaxID=1196353 RepID=UPI00342B8A46